MASANRRSPSDLVLKCASCGCTVDLAAGGVDEHGYVLCEKHLAYQRGYVDGRADAFREATNAVLGAAEESVIAKVRSDVERLLEVPRGER